MTTDAAARTALPHHRLDRRLGLGLLLSLALHGLLLSLQFGVPGWKPGREGRITVALAPSVTPPVAEPAPAADPAAAPVLPEPGRPAGGVRLLDPAAPAPPQPRPEPARRGSKPRRRPARPKAAPQHLNEAVIAHERSAEPAFVVPPAPAPAPGEAAGVHDAVGATQTVASQTEEAKARALADEQARRLEEEQRAALARVAQEEAAQLAARERADEQARRVHEQERAEQARLLAQDEERRRADEERLLALERQRELERLAARRQQEALARKQAEQLAQRQQAEAEEALRKAAALAAQRQAEQLARERAAELMAERRRQEELARQRAEQQLAERRREEELARQAARQQAAQEAALAAAPGPATADPAPGRGTDRQGEGTGAAGGGEVPRKLVPGDLASRARDMARGIDLLRSVPPAARPAEDAQAARRRVVSTGAEGDVPLRLYIDSVRQKIERNAALIGSQLGAPRVRIDPLVSVALRSDGSVEEVTILRSSGRADLDEAVRRLVRLNARYSAFPPNVAARYDVIEIRRIWAFAESLTLREELR